MARRYAQIRLSIWSDDDFMDLSPRAQHLYFVLLTDPTMNFCGVADWRPKKLASRSNGWTIPLIEQAADELAKERYIVLDEAVEEVLIRSFIRNDEVMKQPNLVVAMVAAFAGIASREIRGVIRDEVWRLSVDSPELACWGAKASALLLQDMIEASPARKAEQSGNPSGKGFGNPSQPLDGPLPDPLTDPFETPFSPVPTPTPAPSSPTETAPTSGAVLLDVSPRNETEGQRVNRIARIYTDRVKLTKFIAVGQVVKAALRTGEYTEDQISAGLLQLAADRRSVTKDSLRYAIEGGPTPARGRSKIASDNRAFVDDPNQDFHSGRRKRAAPKPSEDA